MGTRGLEPPPFNYKITAGQGGLALFLDEGLAAGLPYSVVLESGKGGRYTYLGLQPVSVLTGKGGDAEVLSLSPEAAGTNEPVPQAVELQGEPLKVLQNWMSGFTSPKLQVVACPVPWRLCGVPQL